MVGAAAAWQCGPCSRPQLHTMHSHWLLLSNSTDDVPPVLWLHLAQAVAVAG